MPRITLGLAAAAGWALAATLVPQAASAAWTPVLPGVPFVGDPWNTPHEASLVIRDGVPWLALGLGGIGVDRPTADGSAWQRVGAMLNNAYASRPRLVASGSETDVVWQNGDYGPSSIQAARYDAASDSWQPLGTASSGLHGTQPAAAFVGGTLYVAYIAAPLDTCGDLRVSRLVGSSWQDVGGVIATNVCTPTLADGNGTALVGFTAADAGGQWAQVDALAANGSTWTPLGGGPAISGRSISAPQLVAVDGTPYLLVSDDLAPLGSQNIQARVTRFDAAGGTWQGLSGTLNPNPQHNLMSATIGVVAGVPVVAVSDDTGALVLHQLAGGSWQAFTPPFNPGGASGLQLADAGGVPLLAETAPAVRLYALAPAVSGASVSVSGQTAVFSAQADTYGYRLPTGFRVRSSTGATIATATTPAQGNAVTVTASLTLAPGSYTFEPFALPGVASPMVSLPGGGAFAIDAPAAPPAPPAGGSGTTAPPPPPRPTVRLTSIASTLPRHRPLRLTVRLSAATTLALTVSAPHRVVARTSRRLSAGTHTVSWTLRDHGHLLRPGRYTVALRATGGPSIRRGLRVVR